MRFKIIILLLLLPLGIYSQNIKVTNLPNVEHEKIALVNDWHYQKGDNLDWAQPNYDDSSWQELSSNNLNMRDSVAIADNNEIVWFRKYIKLDRPLDKELFLEINQQGASEIYLDGMLIYEIGNVSNVPDEIVNFNPNGLAYELTLEQGKEHVLAVRYVNGHNINAKKESTHNSYLELFATTNPIPVLTQSLTSTQWTSIGLNWRYQKGDNSNWAKPEFDDSSWFQFSNGNLNSPDNVNLVAKSSEIAWFRRPIKADSTLTNALVLRISQTGASEIYLDGVLIRKLGNISSNPNEFEKYNPNNAVFLFPLLKNKEQLLAVRFQNSMSKYPVYDSNSYLAINTTSLNNVLSNGAQTSFYDNDRIGFTNNLYIVLGIGLFMFILFLCLYLFFPREKINGYFALTSLFFSGLIVVLLLDNSYIGLEFKYELAIGFFSIAYLLSSIYCIYKIFNKRFSYIFWSLTILGIVGIPTLFLINAIYIGAGLAVLVFFEMIRISIMSLKTDKIGALIFLTVAGIDIIFWVLVLLHILNVIQIQKIGTYQPFAFMLLPLSIAIYLGYIFGKRSQSLRLNLKRVQKLSQEKETILSKQNETLETQVKERTASLNTSINDLKAAQSQLIQSEKMASLGELTAGIAHEIQNPLNFVNNFSEVSNELIDEMNEELDKGDIEEAKFIASDIKQNLEKINHHGKRADGIVKGMLQHSRKNTGKKEATDINKLADEYFRLAYHGLRAKDKSFNAQLETDYDDSIKTVNIIPQDIGRVILNLLTNAFYAVNEKLKSGLENYEPTVSINTKKLKDGIEIKIRDNGNGMPNSVKEKVFQPFFTTKPTGQGTGLGLSMSYDIITKGHCGELQVESTENQGTTMKIILPL